MFGTHRLAASGGTAARRRRPRGLAVASALLGATAILLSGSGGATLAQSAEPSATPAPTPISGGVASVAPGVTLIRWFCCIGTGDDPTQVAVERQVVDAFNASHSDIQISFEGVPYLGANDALATEIASGNPPDIVGPVGIGGGNGFADQWLDLGPLIAKTGYDLSQFQQGAVDFYKIGDHQLGLPFAIYPSELWFKRSMFDEIGLAYPPQKYGEKYTMPDGSVVDWNYDTVRKLALLLTVDRNGKDATDAAFDPTQITQYGFEPQRDDLRGLAASWAAGSLVAPDGKTVQIPPAWEAAWKYLYNGIWTDHTIMTSQVFQTPEMGGGNSNPFCSGKVAMHVDFLWSSYCLDTAGDDWDVAAVPSYDGQTTAAFNADTFRILKGTQHPDQAFVALTYLLGDAAKQLTQLYGGLSARPDLQASYFTDLDATFKLTQPPDWQVALDGVPLADNPNFESAIPHYLESVSILNKYQTKWTSTPGLDMDKEIALLKSELQAAWDK